MCKGEYCTVPSYVRLLVISKYYRMQDMYLSGATLAEILRAGQWRSAAFLRYLDEARLQRDMALEIAIQSDGEEYID